MFQDAADKVFPHVVALMFTTGPDVSCGTGTIVNSLGYILTANHVVPEKPGFILLAARNFRGMAPGVYQTAFEIIARFPKHDLIIIKCPQLSVKDIDRTINFSWERLSYGVSLGSFGYPQPHFETNRKNEVGAPLTEINVKMDLHFKSYFIAGSGSGTPPHSLSYKLDSFAYGGHSGGPVFDVTGKVVAVMSATHLHHKGRYEISYCEAKSVLNIRGELEKVLKN